MSERWHNRKNHGQPFESCWKCARERAVCNSKIRYASYEAAEIAVTEINHREGYANPVTRYRCRECDAWHLTTAKDPRRLRRAERARRKWLLESVS